MKTKVIVGGMITLIIIVWVGLFYFGAKVESPAPSIEVETYKKMLRDRDEEVTYLKICNQTFKFASDYFSKELLTVASNQVQRAEEHSKEMERNLQSLQEMNGMLIQSEILNLQLQWKLFVITNHLPRL